MDIINQAMLFLLNSIHSLVGNYGLSIVLLTLAIRIVTWPLNSSQTRSMKKMQELQPKLKAIQAKYKDKPQEMQAAMMKFYSENSFNPLGGCLPMLIQLPIFIGLYGALSSPEFLVNTVHEKFLFLNNLSHTLQGHAGESLDGKFNVLKDDQFAAGKTVTLTLVNGNVNEQVVSDSNKAITITPRPILPGTPVTMVLDLKAIGLSDDYKSLIDAAELLVINNKSRELESVKFTNNNGALTQTVETVQGQSTWNLDVLYLIIIYGILTLAYQQVMTGKTQAKDNKTKDDPAAAAQASAMKFMPLMFVVMLFFFPIPSGAMIYLVVTTALMFIQTVWVNYSEDKKTEKKGAMVQPGSKVVDIKAE
ncbi:MAG: YidC/Oxa1 family membrane protein insertase [Cyanobacteria bacterium P01_H01_bin.74]